MSVGDPSIVPNIVFTEPSSQQVFTNIPSIITIQGYVLSNIKSLTANGVQVDIDPSSGFFQTDVSIDEEGTSQIKVVATDEEGNISEASVSVTYDITSPTLELTELSSPQVITTLPSILTIQGTAADSLSGVKAVTINGVEVPVDPETGFFQADVSVGTEDISQIMVVATDSAGNTVEFSVPLTYNLTSNSNPSTGTNGSSTGQTNTGTGSNNNNPGGVSVGDPSIVPNIVFTEPSSQQVFTNIPSIITIQGYVLSNIKSLTANGVQVDIDPSSGFFQTDVSIDEEGTSQIKVVATDEEGNISEASVSVTYDITSPTLELTELSSPQVITTLPSILTIQGTAADSLSGVKAVTINGVEVPVDPETGFFQADVSVGTEDISQIMVVATDSAGNTVEFSVPLTYNLTSNSNPSTGTNGSSTGQTNTGTGSNNNNPGGVSVGDPSIVPNIVFTEPSSQQVFTNIPSIITIQGYVLSNIKSLTANGVQVDIDPSSGFFQTDVSIDEEGTSQIKVVATDEEGNISEASVSVTYDITSPTLELTELSSPQVITTLPSILTIQGTAADSLSGVTSVTVNGVEVPVDPVTGFFQADVSVGTEDISQIMVVATDSCRQHC